MNPHTRSKSLWRLSTVLASSWFLTSPAFTNEKTKPAPRPGTLGAYALHVTLDRSVLMGTGRVVLTNDNVAGVARGGKITLGSVVPPAHVEAQSSRGSESAERERWTNAHHKQSQVIAGLKQRRTLLEIDVRSLEVQRPTPKLLARLDQARAKLRHIDTQISHEKEILARIVRQARQRGAQPDWFR